MRLLTLDFLNVNSLGGHWHIDFTVANYRTSPLFAITGSTGSGKSSILDAVSLALYGETPRVKNAGEKKTDAKTDLSAKDRYDESCPMLTKGTKEIRASVRFEASGRLFGSTWRRYVKRTGKLSEAQVELIEYASETDTEGRILTTKAKEWSDLIVQVTKMNFKTFTRSVLLAQGAFSNFLRASENDRAQILEDITGTDIYSEIGRRVYDRWKTENQKTADMKTRLEASAPLPSEERATLEKETADIQTAHTSAKKTLDTLTAALNWRRETNAAEATVTEKIEALTGAENDLKAYETESRRAGKARAALAPIRLYQEGKRLEHDIEDLDRQRNEIAVRLGTLEAHREARTAAIEQTSLALTDAKKAVDDFAIPYREMIEADTAITGLIAQKNRQAQALIRAQAKRKETESAAQTALAAEKLALRQVEADKAEFDANRVDDLIEPQLNGLTAAVAILTEKKRALTDIHRRVTEAEEKVGRLEKTLNDALAKVQADTDAAQSLRATQAEVLRRYETAKGSDTPETAFEAVADLTARMVAAGEAQRLLEDRAHFAAGLTELKAVVERNEKLNTFLESTLTRFDTHLGDLDTREPGLIAQLASGLDAYVARLTAERHAIIEHTAEVDVLRTAADRVERLARDAERTALESESARLKADTALSHEKESLTSLRNTLKLTEEAFDDARNAFKTALSSLPETLREGTPETVLVTLNERARVRRTFLDGMQKNRDALHAAQEKAAVLRRDTDNACETVTNAQTEVTETDARLTERLTDRRNRFGDTDPNREKTRLTEVLNSAQKAYRAAEENDRQAREETNSLTMLDDSLKKQRAKNTELLSTKNAERDQLMMKEHFADIDSLLSAELTTTEIETIEREAKRRADKAALLSGQMTQAKETYDKLEAMKLSDDNATTLAIKVSEVEGIFLQLTQKGAQLAEKLETDNRKREANAAALKAIEAQTAIADQWDRLRELIGSSTGQVFRAAAQKITFRILLQYANEAMSTMTGRYWLHAAGEGGLSVDVIDNDMGGQIRTSKNLSGGESFMVSLALALGLSRMGGKNLRVDTLFLDEGFGTLDDTTLNNALYALENLQASSGKLIGIISHVKSVKDRIQNHITVTQRAGSGLSTLRGPGVTRLTDA